MKEKRYILKYEDDHFIALNSDDETKKLKKEVLYNIFVNSKIKQNSINKKGHREVKTNYDDNVYSIVINEVPSRCLEKKDAMMKAYIDFEERAAKVPFKDLSEKPKVKRKINRSESKLAKKITNIVLSTVIGSAIFSVGIVHTEKRIIEENKEVISDVLNGYKDAFDDFFTGIGNTIIDATSFNYNYEDRYKRSDFEEKYYKYCCEDGLLTKCCTQFGLDKNLMFAIAMQESGCNHDAYKDRTSGGIGMMQIEAGIFDGYTFRNAKVLNEATGEYENKDYFITDEFIRSEEGNVIVACLNMQWCLKVCDGNTTIAIAMYNKGYGTVMNEIISRAENDLGLEEGYFQTHPLDERILNYIPGTTAGDDEYLQHILSYIIPTTEDGRVKQIITIDYETGKEKINRYCNDYYFDENIEQTKGNSY